MRLITPNVFLERILLDLYKHDSAVINSITEVQLLMRGDAPPRLKIFLYYTTLQYTYKDNKWVME